MAPTKVTSGPKKAVEIVLKVAEAGPKDVGRGIARVALEDIKRALTETVQWPLEHPELFKIAATRPDQGLRRIQHRQEARGRGARTGGTTASLSAEQ